MLQITSQFLFCLGKTLLTDFLNICPVPNFQVCLNDPSGRGGDVVGLIC
jgi:hypothetical protein